MAPDTTLIEKHIFPLLPDLASCRDVSDFDELRVYQSYDPKKSPYWDMKPKRQLPQGRGVY